MILELAHAIWKNGFNLSVVGTLVFLFLKLKKVKKKIRQFIKWLPEDESELRELIINLKYLFERMGLEWQTADTLKKNSPISATKNDSLSPGRSTINTYAHHVIKFIRSRWRKMSNINKALLVPLLSAIALFVKQAFGYEIPNDYVNIGADVILAIITVIGMFMNPKKKKTEETTHDFITPIEPRL